MLLRCNCCILKQLSWMLLDRKVACRSAPSYKVFIKFAFGPSIVTNNIGGADPHMSSSHMTAALKCMQVKSSLRQWNSLNRVRTVASVVAFCLATAGLAASPKTLDRVHIAY